MGFHVFRNVSTKTSRTHVIQQNKGYLKAHLASIIILNYLHNFFEKYIGHFQPPESYQRSLHFLTHSITTFSIRTYTPLLMAGEEYFLFGAT